MSKPLKFTSYIGFAVLLAVVSFVLYTSKGKVKPNNINPSPTPWASINQIFEYDCQQGKTAFDFLAEKFNVESQDSNLGKMVVGINGIKPQGKQYWAFYIDGKLAPVGAETYTCKTSEKIEWKLEVY